MPRPILRRLCVVLLTVLAAGAAAQPVADLRDATPGVRFASPVGVELAPGLDGRLFVLEQGGFGAPSRVLTLEPGDAEATVFLDLSDRVIAGGEAGLLGLAFHPEYEANGRVFVSYTAPTDAPVSGERVFVSRVSEFARSADDPLTADPESERVVLAVDQPADNHNGGTVDFGPDGLLYIGLGDGGGAGDPFDQGQDPTTLLGTILRIDVDDVPEGQAYGIPDDNPFAATDGPERDEIYAYGFRNPFKFDVNETGLWVGDVGQNAWEEIDLVVSGGNYGWNEVEGPACFRAGCDLDAYEPPFVAYRHGSSTGRSVTGGVALSGADFYFSEVYVYGDFISGRLWAVSRGGGEPELLYERFPDFEGGDRQAFISSIDAGPEGIDILVTDYVSGTIYQLVSAATSAEAAPEAGGLGVALAGPNPFRERTAVQVSASGPVRVVVVDALGREVAVLWDGPPPAAPLAVDGAALAPGVYTVAAASRDGAIARRVVRVR